MLCYHQTCLQCCNQDISICLSPKAWVPSIRLSLVLPEVRELDCNTDGPGPYLNMATPESCASESFFCETLMGFLATCLPPNSVQGHLCPTQGTSHLASFLK